MKKKLLFCICALCLASFSLSAQANDWFSIAGSYAFGWEKLHNDGNTALVYENNFGFSLGNDLFFSHSSNFGFHVRYSFLAEIPIGAKPYYTTDLDFGLAFRIPCSFRIWFHGAFGPSVGILKTSGVLPDKELSFVLRLSVFAELGVKIDITSILFVDFGVIGRYHFVGSGIRGVETSSAPVLLEGFFGAKNYQNCTLQPYVSIGFMIPSRKDW